MQSRPDKWLINQPLTFFFDDKLVWITLSGKKKNLGGNPIGTQWGGLALVCCVSRKHTTDTCHAILEWI